jgi:arylsulfatase A-like enzyme
MHTKPQRRLALFMITCAIILFRLPCSAEQPNFILIFADDLGYGDLGCYGAEKHRTPHIDRMAAEGMRFTDFYSSSGVCTPSRSSLLTGCYPRRLNLEVDEHNKWVLFPNASKGLHPDEITVADMLKEQGYATACIGKWHLGDQMEFLPTRQGFDSYYGIPYSNDMDRKGIPLPLMRNETVIEAPVNQVKLTQNYTAEALQFIEENQHRPFFLYLPHTMPHIPLYASEGFKGKSANGDYGDAVEEMDWSTGEILKRLKTLGIDRKTIVIFTSDNGADPRYGGSNAPFSGFKGDTDEGSMRVPFVVRWPGHVPAGTACGELASTIDILPTFAVLSGGRVPDDRIIDGKDIGPLLKDVAANSPHEAFYYYHTTQLQAVRSGQWKLILPQDSKKRGWSRHEANTPLKLIDLSTDIKEAENVSEQHPEIVEKLLDFAAQAKRDLGDEEVVGDGQRSSGWVAKPSPRVMVSAEK